MTSKGRELEGEGYTGKGARVGVRAGTGHGGGGEGRGGGGGREEAQTRNTRKRTALTIKKQNKSLVLWQLCQYLYAVVKAPDEGLFSFACLSGNVVIVAR